SPAAGNASAATQAAATQAAVVPTTVAAQPSATGAGSAPAPAQVASAIAVASAVVQGAGGQSSAKKIDPCLLLTRSTAEAAAKTTLELLRQYSDVTGPAC